MAVRKKHSNQLKNKKKMISRAGGLVALQLVFIGLFCSAAFILWLDHRIRTEFEGKKWALPARVFASPPELYHGARIDRHALEKELHNTGYHRVNKPQRPGEYAKAGDQLIIYVREFEFWDGKQPAQRIVIDFQEQQIDALADISTGASVPVLRLEPQLIGKIHPEHHEDRILVAYEEVPPLLVDALIAVEDRDYFSHFGIDPRGILRAAWANLRSGDVRQGGSTLTQQLVKNFFLSQERTLWRKFNEVIMAILLERHYSKSEILAAYINEIYLGQHGALGIHGFGTAAEYYFARPLGELSIDQLALLTGLVRGASYYNPRKHPERALARRNLVLQQMFEQGYLDKVSAVKAAGAPLDIAASPRWSSARYPAFLELVKRQLQMDYRPEDLRTEGLRIFTTLNPVYQDIAEQAVTERLKKLELDRGLPVNTIEAAGVISSVETGEILSLIGGRDPQKEGFNRAVDAKRPIGSLIKPAIYLTALARPDQYNVLTPLQDEPISVKQRGGRQWTPDNYDGQSHGTVPLHRALEMSYNLATVRLGMTLGMERIRALLKQLGINETVPDYPSVYLGALELSPLQVTQMYQTLASNGFQIPLRAIREVLDKNGAPLQRYGLELRQTIDSRAVHVTNVLLTGVVNRGTAKSLSRRLPELMPLAGKTGTTNDLRDSWFAGFGDDILGVVWLGRDDNQPAGLTGATGALQVWIDMMQQVRPQPLLLVPPEGVVWLPVLDEQRVLDDCPGSQPLPFIEPYLPPAIHCSETRPQREKAEENPWSIFELFQ